MQKSFLYAVFATRLLTPKGKALVRKYETSYDARRIWVELVTYYQSSTGAVLESQTIMTWLTTFRLGRGSKWRQSYYSFVLYFDEKVELYNSMTRNDDSQLNDDQAMNLLKNAVSHVPALAAISTSLEIQYTLTGHAPTMDQYRDLLLSACATYDQTHGSARSSNDRGVNMSDLMIPSGAENEHNTFPTFAEFEAFVAEREGVPVFTSSFLPTSY